MVTHKLPPRVLLFQGLGCYLPAYPFIRRAVVVELVDTHDSGSCAKSMRVRVSPTAPLTLQTNPITESNRRPRWNERDSNARSGRDGLSSGQSGAASRARSAT